MHFCFLLGSSLTQTAPSPALSRLLSIFLYLLLILSFYESTSIFFCPSLAFLTSLFLFHFISQSNTSISYSLACTILASFSLASFYASFNVFLRLSLDLLVLLWNFFIAASCSWHQRSAGATTRKCVPGFSCHTRDLRYSDQIFQSTLFCLTQILGFEVFSKF